MNNSNNIIGFALLALGVALAGYFISGTVYKSRVGINTATVKGLSERIVKANKVTWNLDFSVPVRKGPEMQAMYKDAEYAQNEIINFIKSKGFTEDEITKKAFEYSDNHYRGYILSGGVVIQTMKVDVVKKARNETNELIAKGINVESQRPVYRFTNLNDIKPQMLSEATENARIAANEFAKNAGVEVGRIRKANQGGFTIRDADDQYNNEYSIKKLVRVVTTITFYLTE